MSEQSFNVSPAKIIDHSRLDDELRTGLPGNYNGSQAFYNSNGEAVSLNINSPNPLSTGEQTTVTTTISAHVANPIGLRIVPVSAKVKTANASPTPIFSQPIPTSCAVYVDFTLMGVSSAGVVSVWRFHGAAKRGGGAPASVGAPTELPGSPFQDAGASTWARTLAISGNNLVISVTGQAATSITWFLDGVAKVFNP